MIHMIAHGLNVLSEKKSLIIFGKPQTVVARVLRIAQHILGRSLVLHKVWDEDNDFPMRHNKTNPQTIQLNTNCIKRILIHSEA